MFPTTFPLTHEEVKEWRHRFDAWSEDECLEKLPHYPLLAHLEIYYERPSLILMDAAERHSPRLVRALLEMGADPLVVDLGGDTALSRMFCTKEPQMDEKDDYLATLALLLDQGLAQPKWTWDLPEPLYCYTLDCPWPEEASQLVKASGYRASTINKFEVSDLAIMMLLDQFPKALAQGLADKHEIDQALVEIKTLELPEGEDRPLQEAAIARNTAAAQAYLLQATANQATSLPRARRAP